MIGGEVGEILEVRGLEVSEIREGEVMVGEL